MQLGIRLAGDDTIPVQDAAVGDLAVRRSRPLLRLRTAERLDRRHRSERPRAQYLPDQTFLRGRQRADSDGRVEFCTIYPGWYPGRTVRIHVMVHIGAIILTSQLYFLDDLNNRVLSLEPYAQRPGCDTTNGTDEIFPTGGDPAVLDVTPVGDGYRAAICLVLPHAGAMS